MTPQGTRLLMLVDDEPAQQRLVTAIVARGGWRTVIASDDETALAMLGTRDGMMLDAVVIDRSSAGPDATALIGALHERRPALPILMLAAEVGPQLGVAALRAGATDLLAKPIAPERLLAALDSACGDTRGELRPVAEKSGLGLGFGDIVGSDPRFRAALAIAAKAARSRVPVLIEGEAGTGRQLLASAIHAASPRERKPLVIVDCAAVPANLLESELFGHEKGAFTGAFTRHVGKLHAADGGTLYLAGASRLPHDAQIRLLHMVRTGEVHPIGARGFREVDVRIIAGADPSLATAVAHGDFREDLFYALATVQVALPSLRDRDADIAALSRHLLARFAEFPGLRGLGITDEALTLLRGFDWPGNVRQLHDALYRAAVACGGDALIAADFPTIADRSRAGRNAPVAAREAGVALYRSDGHLRTLEEIEADVIRLAIGHYRGRMTEVARRLGIGRSTLYRKLAELGIGEAA